MVFSLFEVFDCLKDYKNIIALDVDMLVLSDISLLLNSQPIGYRKSRILADIFNDPNVGKKYKDIITPNAGCIVVNEKIQDFGLTSAMCYEAFERHKDQLKNGYEEAIIALLLHELGVPSVLLSEEYNCSLASRAINSAKIVHYHKAKKPWDSVYSLLAVPEYSLIVDEVNKITDGKLKNIDTTNTGYSGILNRLFNMKFNEQIYTVLEKIGASSALRPSLNIEHSFLEFSLVGSGGRIKYIIRHNQRANYLGDNFLNTCNLSQVSQLEVQIKVLHKNCGRHFAIVDYFNENKFEEIPGQYFHFKKQLPVATFAGDFKKLVDETHEQLRLIYSVLKWD